MARGEGHLYMVVLEKACRTSLLPRNQSQRIHWPRIAHLGIILLLFYSSSQQLTNPPGSGTQGSADCDGSKLPSPHFEPLIWIVGISHLCISWAAPEKGRGNSPLTHPWLSVSFHSVSTVRGSFSSNEHRFHCGPK